MDSAIYEQIAPPINWQQRCRTSVHPQISEAVNVPGSYLARDSFYSGRNQLRRLFLVTFHSQSNPKSVTIAESNRRFHHDSIERAFAWNRCLLTESGNGRSGNGSHVDEHGLDDT